MMTGFEQPQEEKRKSTGETHGGPVLLSLALTPLRLCFSSIEAFLSVMRISLVGQLAGLGRQFRRKYFFMPGALITLALTGWARL